MRLALGYKLIFDATIHELLPQLYLEVARQVGHHAKTLLDRRNQGAASQRSACKAAHLQDLVRRIDAIATDV